MKQLILIEILLISIILNLSCIRENIEADLANGVLKNETFALLLKYLSNFWKSFKIPLTNCKVELKVKLTEKVLCFADSNTTDSNNIIFTDKRDTQLYVAIVTLSVRDNQKLPKLVSKGLKRSAYWNDYKTKSEAKNTGNEYR